MSTKRDFKIFFLRATKMYSPNPPTHKGNTIYFRAIYKTMGNNAEKNQIFDKCYNFHFLN